jgi:hypothetical protein
MESAAVRHDSEYRLTVSTSVAVSALDIVTTLVSVSVMVFVYEVTSVEYTVL